MRKKFIDLFDILLILVCCAIISLCACGELPQPNQKIRREVFNECLERAPKDKDLLNGSSWQDIINTCDNYAYNVSIDYDERSKPKQH